MLTPRKKLTRKELHKDPLLEKVALVTDMAQVHSQKLTYAAIGLIALIAISYAYMTYKKDQDAESINKLVAAEQIFYSGDYKEAIRRLEKYCTEYEGTQGGGLGTFYLASSYYNTDQFDFALNYYNQYIDDYGDNSLLVVSSMAGIAACYEGQNKYEEAAQQYEKVVNQYPDFYLRGEYMMDAARCYKVLGKIDIAKQWFDKVIKELPETVYSRDAKLALDELGA